MKKELQKCEICGKGARVGCNRPNSLHKTKKKILPNLQKVKNKIICTRCLKKPEAIF